MRARIQGEWPGDHLSATFLALARMAYADLVIDGHRQTWPIRSRRFWTFLRRSHYQPLAHRGISVRKLYATDAEVLFDSSRPMLLNDIADVIPRRRGRAQPSNVIGMTLTR
jgi:hypothetical protein